MGIYGSFHVGKMAAVQNSLTLPSAKVKNVGSYTSPINMPSIA